jgi:hypothetical protein
MRQKRRIAHQKRVKIRVFYAFFDAFIHMQLPCVRAGQWGGEVERYQREGRAV